MPPLVLCAKSGDPPRLPQNPEALKGWGLGGLASSRAGALSFVFIHSVRAFLAYLGIQRGRAVLRAGILVDARDVSYSVTENQVVIPVRGIVDAKLREHHQYHRKCEMGMSPTNTTQYHTPNGSLKKKKGLARPLNSR